MSVKTRQNEKRKHNKKRSNKNRSKSRKNSRLIMRYLISILDIIKKNKLKVILFGLIITALILTFSGGDGGSSSHEDSDYEVEDKDYLFNQKVQYDFYNNNGHDDGEYVDGKKVVHTGKDGKGPSYVVVDGDSEVSPGLDVGYDPEQVENKPSPSDVSSSDDDSTGTIVNGDDDSGLNSDLHSDDTDFYTMDEDDKKIDIRVQEIKEKWLKSDFAKDHPNINFDDTVIGATAPSLARQGLKPKAALVMFITDFDITEVVKTINSIQTIYNYWLQYPWILISADGTEYKNPEWMDGLKDAIIFNDAEDDTKISLQIATKEYYDVPAWVDMGKVAQSRNRMRLLPHGDSMKYRQYTRYISGFLAIEPFMKSFDWMWYLKPGTELLCDIDYDLFRMMQDEEKLIGFAGTIIPSSETQENVWKLYKNLKKDHKDMIAKDNFEKLFLKNKKDDKDKDDQYESCDLLLSDLGLSNLNVWRSKTFGDFYTMIDKDCNVFHNGWSIDTIQSLALALFTRKNQFIFFEHLGFHTDTYTNCPINDDIFRAYRCKCDQGGDMTFSNKACSRKLFDELKMHLPDNWDKHNDVLK